MKRKLIAIIAVTVIVVAAAIFFLQALLVPKYMREEFKEGAMIAEYYDNAGDNEGTLVFVGNKQNKEYDKWFMQSKPITPIYHTKMDLEENVVYDE